MKWLLILVLSVLAISMATAQRGVQRPGSGNSRPDGVLVANNNNNNPGRPVTLPERLPNRPIPQQWLRGGN